MTPARYRRAGEGAAITYTIASCEFGRMLVAATERGVASIDFAASDGELEATLRHEFAAAEIRRDDAVFAAGRRGDRRGHRRRRAAAPRAARRAGDGVPHPRVGGAAGDPRGETRSYSEIARAIGAPKAVRAVGSACATNPTPIVVPCHRVVREDGSLGGYRYGLDRKRALLEREKKAAAATPHRNGASASRGFRTVSRIGPAAQVSR